MKAALVTPWLPHLPFHPNLLLGYGAAILGGRYDLEVIDLNAELYFRNRRKLKRILHVMDQAPKVSDAYFLYPFYDELETQIERAYAAISWEKYPRVYITTPSWFPTVPAEAVLRLSHTIRQVSGDTRVFFFGNSLGSWTNEEALKKNGVQTVHLNDLFTRGEAAKPIHYDLLPSPRYAHRGKYLFDLLPFILKHGCSWGKCGFCSLSKGGNSGYLERSAKTAFRELEVLIDRYDPAVLVCRDHSLNGHNLNEFCGYLERFNKPWCGASRADLSGEKMEALGRAGCRVIFFGLESGSDRTLRTMNKGITTKQMSDFIKGLDSCGILPAPSLVIGCPGESSLDFEKTIQFLADHRRYLEVVNVYPFRATPASEFSSQKKQPANNALLKLVQLVQWCEDLGMKVCVGEQCIEYFLFHRVYTDRPAVSGGRSHLPFTVGAKGGNHGRNQAVPIDTP